MSGLEIAIPMIVTALGSMFGGGSGGSTMSQSQKVLLENALRNQNNRVMLQNPLYEMATQLAMRLMPRSATPSQFKLPKLGQVTTADVGGHQAPPGADIVGHAVPRGTPISGVNETVTRLGQSKLFQMPRSV